MGMNQPPMMQGQPAPNQMHQDMSPQNPTPNQQPQGQPDPMEALPLVVLSYLDFAQGTKANNELADNVKAQIMLQMAQAINYLVPLLPKADPQAAQDMQMKIADFQLKQQQSQQDLQLKAAQHTMDMRMKQHELQAKQAEQQQKLSHQEQMHQQQMQHQQVSHQQNIVQNQENQKIKAQQAKQASQSKQGNNSGSNQRKKVVPAKK